jgi:CspA family cold shock protein
MSNNSRFTGIVIFFDPKKGYGFIKRDDSTLPDMFVHFSDIETQGFKTLHKDQRGENKKGQPKATEVCVIQ